MTHAQYRTSSTRENSKYSLIVEKITSSLIDKETLHNIEQIMTLSLYDLVVPSINFRTGRIPRPQNNYIIYRRNFQAHFSLCADTTNFNLDTISKLAAKTWRKEPKQTKAIFDLLAACAKKIHKCIFPHYVYNPKRSPTTNIPMLFNSKYNLPLKNKNPKISKNHKDSKNPKYIIKFPQNPKNPKNPKNLPKNPKNLQNLQNPLTIESTSHLQNPSKIESAYPLTLNPEPKSLLTLEIKPDFMNSFDKRICKKFDENVRKFL